MIMFHKHHHASRRPQQNSLLDFFRIFSARKRAERQQMNPLFVSRGSALLSLRKRPAKSVKYSKTASRMLGLVAILAAATLMTACSSKKNGSGLGLGADGQDPNAVGYRNGGPVIPGTERDFTVNVGNKVYFKTDSSRLTADAEKILQAQAKWLNRYPNHTITIEGHSDERGTREYNLGLAAKRAQVIKSFLARHGVNIARLRTISYGKERPVAMCNDISCWSQNRRGVTLLNKRG